MSEIETESLLKSLAKRLRELRKQCGLTQEEFAEAVDLSVSYISMMERAERVPHLETLVSVARALGTTVGALLAPASEQPSGNVAGGLLSFIEARGLTALEVSRLESVARQMFPARDGGGHG
ncbi:helix-turn-helix domain-containing protein [Myxococcus sp. CA040A]|uniref:helix-turn-helix domain-containing protein n=1 Tax=Myxococcus sp. CA040A TaxID=2741738 RepID=UPI00157B1572|nr:helix-turn-helix transcriptional regulator [Myxococcus sp. CA040A]NTX08925.1 helix-turn-helix transcriptional regulator [Myxococcus sp. CA040A]